MGKKTVALTVLATVAAAYIWINCKCCNPPKPPHVDLDEWWGPSELKGKRDTTVRPFKVEFSDEMVKDLRQRLNEWRPPPPPLEGVGFRYGFNTSYLSRVAQTWRDEYDFQERQNVLNRYPHFKTQIQGLDVHFLHVKPAGKSRAVLPLLLLHGWPGSVREFYEVIPLLTAPQDNADFVFELIIPSLPGYGFSDAAVRPGLGAFQAAVIMKNLMHRLGHKQYYIQGGDWGATIGSIMATLFPSEVLGLHSNMLGSLSGWAHFKGFLGSFFPSFVVEEKYVDRMYPLSDKFAFMMEEMGYCHLQATKPDTVGVALNDSPAGLAAYILEKFSTWTNSEYRNEPDGNLTTNFKLLDLLDNIMIYWTTSSITTSMRMYAETLNKQHWSLNMDEIPTAVPTWALKTRFELTYQPDSFLRDKYTNLLGSTALDIGGHFAAFELPDQLADDVFSAVEKFRQFRAEHIKTEL